MIIIIIIIIIILLLLLLLLLSLLLTWWDAFSSLGPDFGCFPNDRKCWIIAKPAKEESVSEAFKDTSINVTVQG